MNYRGILLSLLLLVSTLFFSEPVQNAIIGKATSPSNFLHSNNIYTSQQNEAKSRAQVLWEQAMAAKSFTFNEVIVTQDAGTTERQDITVQLLDGRNGKPMAHERILVFTGQSIEDVRWHRGTDIDVTTDKDGVGTLTINPTESKWLQPFVDFHKVCYSGPNNGIFNVEEIITKGIATPNDCSKLVREPSPGHFIIFARPAHLWEKMRW